ncbi:hypothetical protein [Huintestinicola butyrica]|uniref:hypothetical protein n=1 Tax=Huintestinicola butyrica TaxID=2981728 RepID=UPI003F81354B|nr:hypothetical protein [Oscillospiraceae bacterium]MBS6589999.1 hypothetical protein [Ruminococcus sp.]
MLEEQIVRISTNADEWGIEMNIDTNTLLLILAILVIIIILIKQNKNNKYLNKQLEAEKKKLDREYHDLLFRYKNYEAAGIDKYNEKPEQKLERIYHSLSYKNKQALVDYAEILEKREKNQGK